ncbi:hypothetical protein PIB30_085222 [Stylosanthes scabra]|uniref:Uncharacterized protein n=1 Tax=Stylosanthes scabra TaxID=79078 RepID=A0ABU6SU42_9FABA|nr:hypothetical protein [Stylosanthes scabra]
MPNLMMDMKVHGRPGSFGNKKGITGWKQSVEKPDLVVAFSLLHPMHVHVCVLRLQLGHSVASELHDGYAYCKRQSMAKPRSMAKGAVAPQG